MSPPELQLREPDGIETELAELRAQVRALADLLIECGVVDAAMVTGRLTGAAARIRGRLPSAPAKNPGFFARLFGRRQTLDGVVPTTTRMDDSTIPVVQLPFQTQGLYGDLGKRGLTPTSTGKCQRCWQVRPLSSDRLCAPCLRRR